MPQAPQFMMSELGSTQPPRHETALRVHAQPPTTQISVAAHAMPHAPQFSWLLAKSTQDPLQGLAPSAHARVVQRPPSQLTGSTDGMNVPPVPEEERPPVGPASTRLASPFAGARSIDPQAAKARQRKRAYGRLMKRTWVAVGDQQWASTVTRVSASDGG